MALPGVSVGRAFALGLTTGAVCFTGTLYWITHVMVAYGGLQPFVAVLVNGALVAYLSLFPALFALCANRVLASFGVTGMLAVPLLWVATELGRTHLFGGFPWVLLGYSQVTMLPVAQLASVLGVYGVSALVALVSSGFALAALRSAAPARDGARFRLVVAPYLPLAAAVATVLGVALWGAVRLGNSELTRAGEPVRVGIVQGNVEQGQKWDPAYAPAIFDRYLRMTDQAAGEGAQLIVWPESSTSFQFEEDRASAERLRRLVRDAHVSLLFGSDEIERGPTPRYYNSAFLVGPDGTTAGSYRKMHLVPFGEYVPLRELFFFAAPLVEAVSAFSPGESHDLLPVGRHLVSTAICYEIVYPDLVRRFVTGGSELLTTITNDAWFGPTSAPYQHFAQASMRAIENGRYLVRSANTGISGVVDPYGRVIVQSGIFEPALLVSEVRYLQGTTIYTRTGDLFAYASVAATLALLAARRGGRRRMGRSLLQKGANGHR